MMRAKRTLLAAAALLAAVALAAYDDLSFYHFNVEQGLSQVSVNDIYQDELGAMWFATRQGVTRYNGTRAEVIQASPGGLPENIVLHLTGDHQGHVYFHTGSGVSVYDLRQNTITSLPDSRCDAIHQGGSGLWICSGNQICRYDQQADSLHHVATLADQPGAVITALVETAQGNLYIGTHGHGVFLMDVRGRVRRVLGVASRVSSLYEDSRGNIWIGSWHNGLTCLMPDGRTAVYSGPAEGGISSEFVRTMVEDRDHRLWIGTKAGLDCLLPDGTFRHYGTSQAGSEGLGNESVWALCCDRQGSIWVGTYFGGVDYFNPNVSNYRIHDLRQENAAMPLIDDIVEGTDGLWYLCTEGWGLWIYNPDTRRAEVYSNERGNARGLGSDNIKRVWADTVKGELWLGTYLGGVSCFNQRTRTFRHYAVGFDWSQGNHVCGILPYDDTHLLIGTYSGLYLLNRVTGEASLFNRRLNRYAGYCLDMRYDHDGNLWVVGRNVVKYNLAKDQISVFRYPGTEGDAFATNLATCLLVDRHGCVWIGTDGAGLLRYRPERGCLESISERDGLQNDFVSKLVETPLGYVLATTTKGFSLIGESNTVGGSYQVRNYQSANGLPLVSLYNGGACVLRSGEIVLAGMDGMVSFLEENLQMPQVPLNIYIDQLVVNNHPVGPHDESRILASTMPYTDHISLSAKQNVLSFTFASDNYIPANQPVCRYRLKGLSNEWVTLPPDKHELQFMNLSRGHYSLELRAYSPVDGKLMAEQSLRIRVKPPLYASWGAFAFYLLVLAAIVWRYMAFVRSRERLKLRIRLEQQQKQQAEEVNQSKLRFFTNISHEFRTPLTLIIGQMDLLMQQGNVPPNIYNRLLGMRRNAVNMQGLINELLEFRKCEQGYLQLSVAQQDLVQFANEVYLSFSEYAAARAVRYEFSSEAEALMIWFDRVQIQKVLYNLISNAFKYTPQGGTVSVQIEELPDQALLRVADTGVGISADDVSRIFDRFYQAENGANLSNVSPGTGLGLSLSKSLVELHHGTISVESRPNAGSIFTVSLPKGRAHFTDEQIAGPASPASAQLSAIDTQVIDDEDFIRELSESRAEGDLPHVLIVEDAADLRQMLVRLFSPLYRVTEAADGQEGYDRALETHPDLILSDLMMPHMSGSELCAKIKANIETCHIPVVLLTAWTATEYTLEGLRRGADDYITKPFNARLLITRCNNLINNRRLLQERFSHMADTRPAMLASNQLDRDFLDRVNAIIEQNLDNTDFDVSRFCREIGMGRTALFAKIKGITGQTPNDYITSLRLKKAAQMLLTRPELNISEVAYMTGFSTPKYFATCFHRQFDKTPSQYRKEAT